MPDSKFLKWKMEQVWKTRGCVCPCHLASWSDWERGYRFYDSQMHYILLWFKPGISRKPKGKKPKGKGFSFLCKGYQFHWINQWIK